MLTPLLLSLLGSAQAQTPDDPWGTQTPDDPWGARTPDDPWGVKPPPPPPPPPPVIEEDPPPPPNSCAALFMNSPDLNPWGNQLGEAESCDRLAAGLWEAVPRFQGEIPQDAVEPMHRAPVGVNGSAAEIQPAAAIQPVPLSGGALGIAQQTGGPRILAGLSVNPTALRTESSADYAAASRHSDFSVNLPIDLLSESANIDNVGMQWRRTLRPGQAGARATALARPAYDQINVPGPVFISEMATLLYRAEDKGACFAALQTGEAAEIPKGCGSGLSALQPYMTVNRAGLAVLQAERADIDAAQAGVLVGLDIGDPTLSGAPGRRGQHLSLEAGLSRPVSTFQLRARGGARLAHLTERDLNTAWLRAAVAGDLLLSEAADPTVLSAGFSGQLALAPTGAMPSNTTNLDLGLHAPLGKDARFGLGLSIPLYGEETRPLLAITADWLTLASGG